MKAPNELKGNDMFDFDKLKARPLYEIVPYEAEAEFYRIATTISLNGDLLKKYQLMNDLAEKLDLTFLARGTTRSVYTVNYDSSLVIKVGYDKAYITDSAKEYENQELIKPFCSKCFEISSTGCIGLFERVNPIRHCGQWY